VSIGDREHGSAYTASYSISVDESSASCIDQKLRAFKASHADFYILLTHRSAGRYA